MTWVKTAGLRNLQIPGQQGDKIIIGITVTVTSKCRTSA